MNFKIQLDRKVVGTLVIGLLMFILMGIEAPYRFSPDIDKIRLLYFPLFFLAVYAIVNWSSSALSEREARLNKTKRLISEMDQSDLDILRDQMGYDPMSSGDDGEYQSLDSLLIQQKQKR